MQQTPHHVLVLNGPNLNLLGQREPEHYGVQSLDDLNRQLQAHAQTLGLHLSCRQSNSEATLIAWIHDLTTSDIACTLFNPAAFTHTSIALRDAWLAVAAPFIEVHLSNIYAREPFRQRSYFSDIALGTVCGFGPESYILALQAANGFLNSDPNRQLGQLRMHANYEI